MRLDGRSPSLNRLRRVLLRVSVFYAGTFVIVLIAFVVGLKHASQSLIDLSDY